MTDTKKLLIPVAVIILAALVLFGASAALKTTTANAEAELTDTLVGIMLPGGGEYTAEDVEDSSGIVRVFRGEGGAVVEMYVSGFMSQLHILVGVQNDGTVTSVSIPESHETYGLGQNARDDWYFLASLIKSTGDLTVADTDAVTGATITSNAVVNAVNNASKFIAGSGEEGGASADGVLTGTANGFAGPITVEVTMDGDTITGVTVVSNSESAPGTALEDIPAAIVAANSPDVDIVAGATYTSNGIINAVKDALSKAGGAGEGSGGGLTGTADGFVGPITVEVTMDGDTITGVTVVSNSETPSIAGAALEQIPAAIVEADSAEVDIVAGATYTSNGIINAVKDALSKAGGTGEGSGGGLTGTADGFVGPITVEVTMDGDTITGVTVVSNSESLPGTALEDIPAAIVAANSPDVDVVAGATYTSNGIINAVKDAIGAA